MKKIQKLAIPYMGSKRTKASWLLDQIEEFIPDFRERKFYDLFGGGAAMSFAAIQRAWNGVVYNELDNAIVELLKMCLSPEPFPSWVYDWVSREEFFDLCRGDNARAGLVKTCWSFGNKGTEYIYGKKREAGVRLLHDYIVNLVDCPFDFQPDPALPIQARRLKFMKEYNSRVKKAKGDLSVLFPKRLQRMESINQLEAIKRKDNHGSALEHMERINHLEAIKTSKCETQLAHLERINRLEATKQSDLSFEINQGSFNDVEVEDGGVIYLDPPYEGTGKYQNDTCHQLIGDYIKTSKEIVFVSGYDNVYDLHEVYSKDVLATLAANGPTKKTERLFCNRNLKLDKVFRKPQAEFCFMDK